MKFIIYLDPTIPEKKTIQSMYANLYSKMFGYQIMDFNESIKTVPMSNNQETD